MGRESKIGNGNSEKKMKMDDADSYTSRKRNIGRPVLIAAILVGVTVIGIVTLSPTLAQQIATRDNLPTQYRFDPNIEAAYLFIVDHQAEGQYIACYCNCKNAGHGSLKNCFIKDSGMWEGHGVGCKLCVEIATDLKALLANGTSLLDARNILDSRYSDRGHGTDTPMPPS